MRDTGREPPRRGEEKPEGGIPDGLLIGVLAFLLGLTALTWTSTGLAGLFSKGAWPDGVGLGDTPQAMRELMQEPHDLPGAWPGTPKEQLTGYGLFWGLFIGQLLVLVVLTVFVMGTVARWRAVRARKRAALAKARAEQAAERDRRYEEQARGATRGRSAKDHPDGGAPRSENPYAAHRSATAEATGAAHAPGTHPPDGNRQPGYAQAEFARQRAELERDRAVFERERAQAELERERAEFARAREAYGATAGGAGSATGGATGLHGAAGPGGTPDPDGQASPGSTPAPGTTAAPNSRTRDGYQDGDGGPHGVGGGQPEPQGTAFASSAAGAAPFTAGTPTPEPVPGAAPSGVPHPASGTGETAATGGGIAQPLAPAGFAASLPTPHSPLVLGPAGTRRPAAVQAVQEAEGPALVVTSDPTLWAETKDGRAKLGPVLVYDPLHLCDTPARLHWSPTRGCEDRAVAAARSRALLAPVRPTARVDALLAETAETLLRSFLHAAAVDGRQFKHVHRWAQGTGVQEAVRILRAHPKAASGAAGELEAALTAYPERRDMAQELTSRSLAALFSVHIREACAHNRTDAITLDSFVHEGGTLYLVGEPIEDPRTQPGAMPLLTALASSVVEHGRGMAARSSSGRLDPPLTLVLDDVAAVAPLPQLPELLSRGPDQGLPTLALLRSREQGRARWPDAELPA
ncbi:hypothetical protein [Streptomyces sp. SCSIO ZS0520]|uniref:hypothetical protein n=1 Tax=Streptomyces sp. SCSIO ZS0520 TaxID=2892996 RepID=UPI0021D9D422|nr:hypothetical protein [Streptomyces sp. SCSIO ZS0520]